MSNVDAGATPPGPLTSQWPMFLVGSLLLGIVIFPVFVISSLWIYREYQEMPLFIRFSTFFVGELGEGYMAKIYPFMLPVFAVVVSLRNSLNANWIFISFMIICLAGMIFTLSSQWFISFPENAEFLQRENWMGQNNFVSWRDKAKIYHDNSFQHFLSFIAILLGVRVAGEKP